MLKAYDMIGNYKASLKSNAMCKSVGCFYPEGTENKVNKTERDLANDRFFDFSVTSLRLPSLRLLV